MTRPWALLPAIGILMFGGGCSPAPTPPAAGKVPQAEAAAPPALDKPKAPEPQAEKGSLSPKADPPAGWGTVKGRVVWAGGDVPPRKPIDVDNDHDHCLGKGPLLSEEWVVHEKNKGVRWTFVWLAPEPHAKNRPLPIHPSRKEIPAQEVVIDQPCCAFEPHALALRKGQNLVVKNSSSVAHNVNWRGDPRTNPGDNQTIPAQRSYTIKGLQPDGFGFPLRLECNLHRWMSARVGVFDHPYFAVTDADGAFEMKSAPAGEYRLMIWHESAGWCGGAKGKEGKKITIPNDGTADVGDVELKP